MAHVSDGVGQVGMERRRHEFEPRKLQWSYCCVGSLGNVVGYTADQPLGGIFIGAAPGPETVSVDTTGAQKWVFASVTGAIPNAVGVDGSVYATSSDDFDLYAISRDGVTLEWTFSPPTHVSLSGASLAVANDGTIYAGDNCGVLYALNPTTGKPKWQFTSFEGDCQLSGTPALSPAIGQDGTVYGGVSYTSLGTGVLFAISSGGKLIWDLKAPWGTPAVAPNGNIYVWSPNIIYALNSKGVPQWQIASPMGSSFSLPAIAPDSSLYVNANGLWWVNSSGVPQWETPLCPSIAPPTIGGDGTIYTVSGSTLCAVNPVGTPKWSTTLCNGQFQTASNNFTEPVIGTDGTIYVAPDNYGVDSNGFSLPLCPLQAFH